MRLHGHKLRRWLTDTLPSPLFLNEVRLYGFGGLEFFYVSLTLLLARFPCRHVFLVAVSDEFCRVLSSRYASFCSPGNSDAF